MVATLVRLEEDQGTKQGTLQKTISLPSEDSRIPVRIRAPQVVITLVRTAYPILQDSTAFSKSFRVEREAWQEIQCFKHRVFSISSQHEISTQDSNKGRWKAKSSRGMEQAKVLF